MQQDEVNVAIGTRVSELRKAKGWSQAELADHLGGIVGKIVDPTTITRLERGRRPVTANEIFAFAQLFEVRPAEILDGRASPIDRAIEHWERARHQRSRELKVARIELAIAEHRSGWADLVSSALEELQEFKRTGKRSVVGPHFIGLIFELPSDGYSESFFKTVDIFDILRDAGVPASEIDTARGFAAKNPDYKIKGIPEGDAGSQSYQRALALLVLAVMYFKYKGAGILLVPGESEMNDEAVIDRAHEFYNLFARRVSDDDSAS